MKTNANYRQAAEARKVAAAAAAATRRQERLDRRAELEAEALRRKAERQLLRARRNYQPGWTESYSPGATRR